MTDEQKIHFMKEEIIKSMVSLSYVKSLTPPESDLDLFLKNIISDILDAQKMIINMDVNND